jgi:heme oxygenase
VCLLFLGIAKVLFTRRLMDGQVSNLLYCKYLASIYLIYGALCRWNEDQFDEVAQEIFSRNGVGVFDLKDAIEKDLEINYGRNWSEKLHDLVQTEVLTPYLAKIKSLKTELLCAHIYVKVFGDILVAEQMKKGVLACSQAANLYCIDFSNNFAKFQSKIDMLCSDNPILCDQILLEANSALSFYVQFFKGLDKIGDLRPKVPYLPPERIREFRKKMEMKSNSENFTDVAKNLPSKSEFEKIKQHYGIDFESADISMCPALNPDGTPKVYSKSLLIVLWIMFLIVFFLGLGIFGYYGSQEFLKYWAESSQTQTDEL